MKPLTRDTLTGLTAMGATAALIAMLAIFGELDRIGESFYRLELRLDTARGLTNTSPVTVHGVRVGQITSLTTAPDPADGVDLAIELRSAVKIPSDFGVYIERGLISGSSLELVVRRGSSAPPVEDGQRFDREAGGLFTDIREQLKEPLATLTENADRVGRLAETYDRLGQDLGGKLSALFGPPQMGPDGQPVQATVPGTLARIDRAAGAAEQLLADEELRKQLNDRLTEAGEVLAALREAAENIRSAGDRSRAFIDDAGDTIQSLAGASEEARRLLAAANDGNGTIGRLVNDPGLYDSLDHSSKELEAVLQDARLLIEKFRTEGVPVRF